MIPKHKYLTILVILNLNQRIEDSFERKQITGVAFIDLSVAYDAINHDLLLVKIYKLTQDFKLTQFIESLMSNRRLFVSLTGKYSRWRKTNYHKVVFLLQHFIIYK